MAFAQLPPGSSLELVLRPTLGIWPGKSPSWIRSLLHFVGADRPLGQILPAEGAGRRGLSDLAVRYSESVVEAVATAGFVFEE